MESNNCVGFVTGGLCEEPQSQYPIAGVMTVHMNPVPRTKMARIAWSLVRHPVKSREFPARSERLVTAADMMRFAV